VLPSNVAALRDRHPDLAVELVLSNRVQDLLRREADIAVRMVRPRQELLVARRIGQIEVGCMPISVISRSTAHPAASPTWQSIRSSASTKRRPSSATPAKPWPAGAVKPLRYGRTATSLSSPSSDPVPASAPARRPSPAATTRWYESFRNSSRCRWKPGSRCTKTCATARAAGSPSMRWSKACNGTSRRRHLQPNVAGYFLLLGAGAFGTSMSSFGTPNWPSSLCSLSRSIAPTIFTMVNCRGSLAIKARPVA